MVLNDTITLDGILQDMYFIGKFNASTFLANDLLRIVNKYYRQLQENIRAVNEDFYLIVATTDLVIGDGSYTLPDGNTAPPYEKIKSIWAALSPTDIDAPLANEYQRVTLIGANQVTSPSYEFSIPTAIMFGDYYVFHPLVTDTTKYPVTRGMKMYYIPQLDKLTQPTDTPNIFPDYHDIITWGSLIDIAPRLSNTELLNLATGMFKKRMEEMKAYASNRVLDNMAGDVIEGQDNGGGWDYPFGQQSMS